MMAEIEPLTLTTFENGALVEMVDRAIAKVAANLADVNTTLAAREIHLIIKAKPSKDRSMVEWTAEVKPPKLAGQEAIGGTALIERENGLAVLMGRKPSQKQIPFELRKGGTND